MKADPAAVERRRLPEPRRRWLRHLLLAVSLVMVALSVVGMHQLSTGHDIATTGSATSPALPKAAHHSHQDGEMLPLVLPEHLGDTTTSGTSGLGDVCPDCSDHQRAFGSCLLALTLLVLNWLLTPPRLRHLPPFLLPRLVPTMLGPALGRLVPPLSLVELSIRRT